MTKRIEQTVARILLSLRRFYLGAILLDALDAFNRNQMTLLAAALSYYALLALFPLLLTLVGLASFFISEQTALDAVLPMGETLIRARYFGTRALGRLTGINEVLNVGGVFIGPILGGVIFDRTGEYGPALLFYAGSLALAALVYAFAVPPRPPRTAQGTLP